MVPFLGKLRSSQDQRCITEKEKMLGVKYLWANQLYPQAYRRMMPWGRPNMRAEDGSSLPSARWSLRRLHTHMTTNYSVVTDYWRLSFVYSSHVLFLEQLECLKFAFPVSLFIFPTFTCYPYVPIMNKCF